MKRDLMLAVDPSLYPDVEGSTDSETFFFLALTFGLEDDPPAAVERAVGLHRARGQEQRHRAPDPDDRGDDRRREASGPSATRASASRARSSTRRAWTRFAQQYPDNPILQLALGRDAARSSRSRSATSRARGTRCPSRATAWSRRARTRCTRSRRSRRRRRSLVSVARRRLGGDRPPVGRAVHDPSHLAAGRRAARRVVVAARSARAAPGCRSGPRRLVGAAASVVVDRGPVRDRLDVLPRRPVSGLRRVGRLGRGRGGLLRRVDLLHLGRLPPVARGDQRRDRRASAASASSRSSPAGSTGGSAACCSSGRSSST